MGGLIILFGFDDDSLIVISVIEENKKIKSREHRSPSMLADKATVVSSEYAYSKLDGLNLNKNFQFSKYLTEKIKSINNGLDFFNLLRSKKFIKECFTESIYIEKYK